jgi:hypothetical protein
MLMKFPKETVIIIYAATAVGALLGKINERRAQRELKDLQELEAKIASDIDAIKKAELRTKQRIYRGDFDGRPLADVMTELRFQEIAAHYE